jgi:ubiquinone/menaquinone biosynthesis C-methylase UbiE
MGCCTILAVLVVAIAAGIFFFSPDVLTGLDSNHDHSMLEIQAIVTAFCFSPAVGVLLNPRPEIKTVGGDFDFTEDGDLENDDYVQGSIYAILYAMYKNAGNITSPHGVKYQFTFNTWGIAPSPYPEEDPQRHGKAAYRALLTQPAALAYKAALGDTPLEIVEIGCGTGAGANLITREVHPTAKYLALDMQQAAINTCNKLHATEDNPGLTCTLVPNGVGHDGNKAPREDSSVDFVVISETHIADIQIGDIEKGIFAEIVRILKPGGLFLWGNAIPTRVWEEADVYLPTIGFELVDNTNHTQGAITARDEDYERVEGVMQQLIDPYPVMKVPYFGPRCAKVCNRLIANFYRHPGTALYLKMVTGFDSYMHQAWRVTK